ncbi:MAG: trypsin-like peptidase domain-containing protein [Candidatus Paceibacterota bacterium]
MNKQTIIIVVLLNFLTLILILGAFSLVVRDRFEAGGVSEESLVVGVVSEAEPAVVSIIARANVPRITEEERRLLEFFAPGFTLPEEGATREVGGASGFFVTSDGLIVTNRHVVENESLEYRVVTSDGKMFDAEVLAKDPIYDVAILKVDIQGAPHLGFGDSSTIRLGQTVLAIGNALSEFANSVTKGIVSGLSRSVVASGVGGQTEMLENVIQTDAGINPGNSGGPLLNLSGRVIGVNVAVVSGSENIGFALPANLVKSIVDSVIETGEIVVPYIGVRYVVLGQNMFEAEETTVSDGVLVTRGGQNEPAIIPGSPAEKAGIQEGDIITHFNGTPIDQKNSFSRLIREAGIGESVVISILRDGKVIERPLVLERVPQNGLR